MAPKRPTKVNLNQNLHQNHVGILKLFLFLFYFSKPNSSRFHSFLITGEIIKQNKNSELTVCFPYSNEVL